MRNHSFLTVGLLALCSLASSAHALSFSDDVFNTGDWTQALEQQGTGGSATAMQVLTGGNTEEYWRVDLTLNAGSGLIGAFYIRSTALYDPSSSGAIDSIDYSEDGIHLGSEGALPGLGQAASPALLQDGIFYRLTPSSPGYFSNPPTGWMSHGVSGLVAADFISVGGGLSPDFSVNGSPISFGFWRGISHPAGNPVQSQFGGIDNWNLTINLVPEPTTLGLLGMSLCGFALAARGRHTRDLG